MFRCLPIWPKTRACLGILSFLASWLGITSPDHEVYLSAVELLSLRPEEVMMTAAHRNDLDVARSLGLRTGFIHRLNEYGPTRRADIAKAGDFDIVANDTLDLATQLGA